MNKEDTSGLDVLRVLPSSIGGELRVYCQDARKDDFKIPLAQEGYLTGIRTVTLMTNFSHVFDASPWAGEFF